VKIFDIMDCEDCDSLRHIPGRTWGDPDSCFPSEDTCREDAPDDGPCDRMLGAIRDYINDGQFELSSGYMHTSEFLASIEGNEMLEDYGFSIEGLDFSSALYFFIPYDSSKAIIPYKDEAEVYKEWFQ
jgi:hypothetical protein